MRHGLLHWYEPGELDDGQRATYEAIAGGPRAHSATIAPFVDGRGRLEGPFNAMLVNPLLGMAVQSVGAALRYQTSLDDRLREMAILTVAVEERSDFEWWVHDALSGAVGVTDGERAALRGGRAPDTLSTAERLAREVVLTLLRRRRLDDDLIATATAALGETALVELVYLTGYYSLLSMTLHAFRTPLPRGADPPFG